MLSKASETIPAQPNRSHYPTQRWSYVKIGRCKESLITVSGLASSDTITRLWMVHGPGFHPWSQLASPSPPSLAHLIPPYWSSGPLLVPHQTALTLQSPLPGINDFSLPCTAPHFLFFFFSGRNSTLMFRGSFCWLSLSFSHSPAFRRLIAALLTPSAMPVSHQSSGTLSSFS